MAIFRSISVGDNLPLTLSEPISGAVKADMTQIGQLQWAMDPGTFHGAETIIVEVDGAGLVEEMLFLYPAGTDYEDMRENFIGEIGEPQDPNDAQRSVWEDAETHFELIRLGGGDMWQVWSSLQNRVTS